MDPLRLNKDVSSTQNILDTVEDRLDPIAVIVNCALMHFKEFGSRLCYSNNLEVFIQQPSDYRFGVNLLPLVRTLKGQERDDLSIVLKAIDKVAAYHLLNETESYKGLLECCSIGLDSLRKIYELKKNGAFAVSSISNMKMKISKVIKSQAIAPSKLDEKSKKIKDIWSIEDIQRVHKLFYEMFETQGKTPVSETNKCKEKVALVEFILLNKHASLQQIWAT